MNQEQNNSSSPMGDTRSMIRWAMIALDGPAMTLRVLMHYRFGSRQPGLAGVMGLLILIFCARQCTPKEVGPVIAFTVLYLATCLIRRAGAARRSFRGDREHSFHDGYSYIARCIPFISEQSARQFIEPLIAVVVGMIVCPVSPPLFLYLFFAGVCLFLTNAAREGLSRRQIRAMQDRYIEQQNLSHAFRRSMGPRRF